MFDLMFEQIKGTLLSKYGHLSYPELLDSLRNDGFGELVDEIKNSGIIEQLSDSMREFLPESDELGASIMPSVGQNIRGIPIEQHDTFNFDYKACLQRCTGNCCKSKNYLMINIVDIYQILSSPAADFLHIKTTIDLFEATPPVLELFYLEEFMMYLPYIRYLPENDDIHIHPEDADGSVCPFLYPIREVYELHKENIPEWAHEKAMGCILMNYKPTICRLSPLGKSRGMKTGNVTYEYLPPALDCPACTTRKQVLCSDYIKSVESPEEEQRQQHFHQMLMKYNSKQSNMHDRKRFNKICLEMYNIDALLIQYDAEVDRRPSVDKLVEIVMASSKGDFSVYEQFISTLN